MLIGNVQVFSLDFVQGEIAGPHAAPFLMEARLDGAVIGYSEPALDGVGAEPRPFVIVFSRPVPADRILDVAVKPVGARQTFPQATTAAIDRADPLRVFILGSPRSGTSEMGRTLHLIMNLPWLGEAHAAARFAQSAHLLSGDASSNNEFVARLPQHQFRRRIVRATREAYFSAHGSSSFVDKTPGVEMINAAPFLVECFPDARFIHMRRNGVANILSRMSKFGGSFEEHCRDWVAAIESWQRVRALLPHCLEIEQETMLDDPGVVATLLAAYLQRPEKEQALSISLRTSAYERTGAGLGRNLLDDTDWNAYQRRRFSEICGNAMRSLEYAF